RSADLVYPGGRACIPPCSARPAAFPDSGHGSRLGRIQSASLKPLPSASNSRYSYRRGRKEKNESRTVFENPKAAFFEHLTHTRFISRKVGFSRRRSHVPPRYSLISTGTGRLTPATWVNRK